MSMAAAEIFERSQRSYTRREARLLLTAAAGMDRFTIRDLDNAVNGGHYGAAGRLLRVLHKEGHLRRVNPEGTKPHVYAWVEA